jgi:hypothetical protein
MNTIIEKENYNEQKGKLKLRFAKLTYNDDMIFADDFNAEMHGRVQTKQSKTKAQMHRLMASLL